MTSPKPPLKTILKAVAKIMAQQRAEEEFVERHGHARFPVYTQLGDGKMMLAIGSIVAKQVREGPYSLLDVYNDCALDLLGEDRSDEELKLPFEERHPCVQFVSASLDQQEANKANGTETRIGAVHAWGRLGYDLFTVRDNAKLLEKLKGELQNAGTYQAGRCELLACAVAVTAGFTIEFEDESDTKRRHVEFVATHKSGSGAISVEAKSRHRNGVLGFKGGHPGDPGAKVGVRNLVTDALTKTEHPLYLFVDVNLPPAPREERLRWIEELNQLMFDLDAEGLLQDSPLHGVFFLNDPSHYAANRQIEPEDSLWNYPVKLKELKLSDSEDDVMDRLLLAWKQRSAPPEHSPGSKPDL